MTVTTTDQATQTITTASTPTQGNTTSTQADTPTKQYLKLAGLILGLSTVLLLMLLAFVTPLLNSGAKDLPPRRRRIGSRDHPDHAGTTGKIARCL